ncbi:hypothetical protein FisN_29Hh051 [Fistulifera solaris]|uniref:Uncharacterized protein n=1 Tax=Fistulifera solaris TaxID=1519565 RepID=A0A1Z5K5X9_FISSO|nr:hypothetical protein FisN_29Hh051 [Fistulifera solaris]|eukprot:GAX21616.1 hypothetical protein FisN_29Hh051 [Fistulifera solaris]
MTDGWDDDDDNLNLEDSNVDGWGDDDFFFPEDEEEVNVDAPPIQGDTQLTNNDGWGDDLDSLDGLEEESVPSSRSLRNEIQQYWEQLEHLQSSLNAVLESEYNTPEKAQELFHYYSQRPALREYTIHKELPRMQYTLITADGDVVEDLETMAALLQHDPTLVAHCANQSLLADLLQVCTGPDLLVRPQYLASAVADHVQFRLDLAAAVVQVLAFLTVSLPTEQGRWSLATVQVQVVFGCHAQQQQPFVEYHIRSIQRNSTPNELQACVRFLSSHLEDLQDTPPQLDLPPTTNSGNNFRDLFLQQSQAVWAQSATGLRSAWKDMDTVTGLSQKLPRFLPDDVLLEAAAASEHQQQQPVQRPSSILEGFVRSGLTKLAQSVALPDEDPSLYTDVPVRIPPPNPRWTHGPPHPSSAGNPLYRLAQGSQHARQPSSDNNPLDRLTHGSQHSRHASSGSNPLDRITQMPSNPVSSQVRVNPLDRLTQGHFDGPSSGASINPLERFTKGHADPTSAKFNPLDRLTQLQNQPPLTHTALANPLDRLTQIHSKPSIESTASSVIRNGESDKDEEDDVVEYGWDDVDDLDLDDNEMDTNQVPLADKLPPGYKYNPEDDIIPTRRRWIDPDPGIRIPRPVR